VRGNTETEEHQEVDWQDNGLPSLGLSTTSEMRVQGFAERVSCSHLSEPPGMANLLTEIPQTMGSE